MREWGSEAITFLVKSALLHEDTEDEKVNQLLLSPLCELSSILHNDVRSKQLSALGQILHCKGDKLKSSWPLAINILGDVYEHHRLGVPIYVQSVNQETLSRFRVCAECELFYLQ